MSSVSCVDPAKIEDFTRAAPDAGDMLSALVRTQKHVGQFVCEVDTRDVSIWTDIAGTFEDGPGGEGVSGARLKFSHLLLWRHGQAVAGARVAIGKRHAVVCDGPFWHRNDANPDLTVYRAVLGALVQEYCMRRGYRLTIVPRPNARRHAQETLALRSFGFAGAPNGGYAFRMPSQGRIMGLMSGVLRSVRRSIMPGVSRA